MYVNLAVPVLTPFRITERLGLSSWEHVASIDFTYTQLKATRSTGNWCRWGISVYLLARWTTLISVVTCVCWIWSMSIEEVPVSILVLEVLGPGSAWSHQHIAGLE